MSDLLFSVKDHVAYITMNRPDSLNAFSEEMIVEWIKALEEVRDSDDIRVVVLSGNGRGFCAGADITEMSKGSGLFNSSEDISSTALNRKNSIWKKVQRVPLLLQEIDKPVIAKMHGFAIGAGLDMALMCDIRIAADTTKLSESYVKVGIVPGDGGAYFLPRIVNFDQALDMLWTGKVLTGDEAKEIGLVTYSVKEDQLDEFVEEYVQKLVKGPQQAIQLIKRAAYQGQRMDLRSHLDQISSHMGIVTELDDHKEGVKAVIEKRNPKFN